MLSEDGENAGAEDKPIKTLFELNDTLFAEAEIQETGDVYLWLGVRPSLPLLSLSPLVLLTTARQ